MPEEQANFSLFLDSSPDRWGRLLMRRREAALARQQERREQPLFESDYLLGVFDGHRLSGLRFKTDLAGPFPNDNRAMAAPPWTSLRELEYASLQLKRVDARQDPDYLKWLFLLVAPGSSLGGARPKASVVDEHDQLWIAKFPSGQDEHDVGAWEAVVHDLAQFTYRLTEKGVAVIPLLVELVLWGTTHCATVVDPGLLEEFQMGKDAAVEKYQRLAREQALG